MSCMHQCRNANRVLMWMAWCKRVMHACSNAPPSSTKVPVASVSRAAGCVWDAVALGHGSATPVGMRRLRMAPVHEGTPPPGT